MGVSIKRSIANVFSDCEFLPKYTILVILSFCVGLLTFVLMAKNYVWLPLAIPLYFIAGVISGGYDMKYLKNLMSNDNSKLPSWTWDNIGEFFLIGARYLIATLIFCSVIFTVVSLSMLMITLYVKTYDYLLLLAFIPLLFTLATMIYFIICFPGILYTFINSNYDVLSFFNFKKNCSYFSVNYFISLFAILCLSLPIMFMGQIASLRLRYALFYIVPLMLAPIFRMFYCNLMAQAYTSNSNNNDGSIPKMFGLLVLLLFGIVLFASTFIILYKKF